MLKVIWMEPPFAITFTRCPLPTLRATTLLLLTIPCKEVEYPDQVCVGCRAMSD